jgi:hypothetical protein
MKRVSAVLALSVLFFLPPGAPAQEQSPPPKAPERSNSPLRDLKSRVFEVKHRDPRLIASAVKLLGSGFPNSDLSVNLELGTITVRDFPENIATIAEAIARLDQPAPGQPDLEFHVYVLIGSNAPSSSSSSSSARELPAELVDVVKELQSTLRYASYGLLTTAVHRTHPGDGVESSGVAETKLLGMTTPESQPVFYSYNLRRVSVLQRTAREAVDVETFRFQMRIPLTLEGKGTQYQEVGFETPVTIREGEKVVVGTTTMGDKALVVVVTAQIDQPTT